MSTVQKQIHILNLIYPAFITLGVQIFSGHILYIIYIFTFIILIKKKKYIAFLSK